MVGVAPTTDVLGSSSDVKSASVVKRRVIGLTRTPPRSNDCLDHQEIVMTNSPKLINKLKSEISRLKDTIREDATKHAREVAIRDEQIASLNDALFYVLGRNSQLLAEITENVVHNVTQAARPRSPDEEARSMITRLKTKTRKDNKKVEYDYETKRKVSPLKSVNTKSKAGPIDVAEVDNFQPGPERGPVKPKPIVKFGSNAVIRQLSTDDKDKLRKMWDNVNTR